VLAQLATLAVLFATILFFLSLPLGDRPAAGALRRAAAFSFILAFVPSILVCAIHSLLPRSRSAMAMLEFIFAGLGLVTILGLLSLAAYGFVDLRNRIGSRGPNIADGLRYAKRPPEERRDRRRDDEEDAP